MRPGFRRVLAGVCLIALLAGLVFHYSAVGGERVTTLSSRKKVASPSDHVGERVYVWARVDADGTAGDERVTLRIGATTFTVVGVDAAVEPGDVVQVVGVIRSPDTIVADRVVVSPRERRPWLYAVSTLGLVLAVGYFLRSWTVALDRAAFVPRDA